MGAAGSPSEESKGLPGGRACGN